MNEIIDNSTEKEISKKTYTLLNADLKIYQSDKPGSLGGHRRGKIYVKLDCPSALRAIAKGGYIKHRVFF
ncbi:hypothetical protein [Lysinibacillus agricola]|uniref:hypothetical protein n=1 Tax=Lysinibacillus TaxID=400634 RepID=UPI000AFBD28E